MNKTELSKILANRTGKTEKEVKDFLNNFAQTIIEILTEQDEVKLIGMFKFYVSKKNIEFTKPGTKEKVKTQYPYSVKVKVGKTIKTEVNKGRIAAASPKKK